MRASPQPTAAGLTPFAAWRIVRARRSTRNVYSCGSAGAGAVHVDRLAARDLVEERPRDKEARIEVQLARRAGVRDRCVDLAGVANAGAAYVVFGRASGFFHGVRMRKSCGPPSTPSWYPS